MYPIAYLCPLTKYDGGWQTLDKVKDNALNWLQTTATVRTRLLIAIHWYPHLAMLPKWWSNKYIAKQKTKKRALAKLN